MRALGALSALSLITTLPAFAQEPRAGDRVGPNAAPVPAPSYPSDKPILPPATPGAPRSTPAPNSATLLLGDVLVTAEPGPAAVPAASWAPAEEADGGLKLDHAPGEALDAAWVRRQFEANGLIGAPTSADRLVALVQRINRAFIQAGFVNSGLLVAGSGVPGEGGALELSLVSGRIVPQQPGGDAIAVTWRDGKAKGLGPDFIRDRMPAARSVPLNAITLERDFRLLAENPAIRTVNADLRPGSRPGEATLLMTVTPQDRFDLYGVLANSRSPSIGGERPAIGGSIRNAAFDGDLLSGEAGVTEGRPDYSLSYATPISPRTTVFARGAINDAAVVDRALRQLNIESKDRVIEGGFTHKLIDRPLAPNPAGDGLDPAESLALGALVSHRRTITTLLGEPTSLSPGAVDGRAEYTALRLTADYIQRNVSEVRAFSLTATMGLEGTRPNVAGLPTSPPHRNFKAVLAQLSVARRLTAKRLELRVRISGQYADGILYSAERFSVGGENSVRGYRENLLLADTGLNSSIELLQPFSLSGGRRGKAGEDLGSFTISAFVDGALLHNRAGAQPAPDSIASIGASLFWTPSDALTARITYAKALNDVVLTGKRDLQDRGVQFRITVRPLLLFR